MSEPDGRGPDDLVAQLDAAFAGARPRRGFTDELWAQLERGVPRRRRAPLPGWAPWPALGALAAVLVLGLAVAALPHLRAGGAGGSAAGPAPAPGQRAERALPGGAPADSAPTTGAALPEPFGPLPAPPPAPLAGGPATYQGPAALTVTASPPPVPARLPVYRYGPALGLAPGSVFDPGGLPAAAAAGSYLTRAPAQAARDAAAVPQTAPAGPGPEPAVTLDRARLVYVAVAAGDAGYLEPAYLFTGTFQRGGATYEKQVLVSALDAAELR